MNKIEIIHAIVMLNLQKTYDFSNPISSEAQLAIEYELQFENVKNQLAEFNPED